MADPTLPDDLKDAVVDASRGLVVDLVNALDSLSKLRASHDPRPMLELLDGLIESRIRQVAVAGYQAGLAKAGEAARAIDDLATLRRAAAILTKVSR